jgi:hypothetical protein
LIAKASANARKTELKSAGNRPRQLDQVGGEASAAGIARRRYTATMPGMAATARVKITI